MTSGAFKGNLFGLYIGGTLIACARDCSFDGTNETIDATCKDNDGAKQVLLGQQGGTFNVDGLVVMDASYGFVDLIGVWLNKTEVVVLMSTEETGDTTITASCLLTNITVNGPLNDVANFSATFETTGAITTPTVSA